MNAPLTEDAIPGCIARREPDAIYAWFSTRRLAITKGDQSVSLSADDLRALARFVDGCALEAQLNPGGGGR